MKLKKDVNDVKIGMHVCDLDKPWVESPFLFQGFEITSDKILLQLHTECKFVYIDTEKSTGFHPSSAPHSTSNKNSKGLEFVDTVILNVDDVNDENFEKDISKGKVLHETTLKYVDGIFRALNKGGAA